MSLSLHPFPQFYHPPFGVVDELPYCRDGVRNLPSTQLRHYTRPAFAELRIRRHINGVKSRGICGLLAATAFSDGTVRPHEQTLESRLLRQEKLVLEDQGALGKPILLTTPNFSEWWARQDQDHHATGRNVDFAGKDNDYQLRSYERKGASPTTELSLTGLSPLVIADGHHRAATHARLAARGVGTCRQVPVCLIGGEEVHIGTFLRVIDSSDLSTEALFRRLEPYFDCHALNTAIAPTGVGEWLLVLQNQYYRLRPKEKLTTTDLAWLERQVLPAVFGIENTRTDPRITFEPIADTPGGIIAFPFSANLTYFCGFPLPKERFFREVAAGRMLPPKSTRFEPRVPSGMVVWMPEVVGGG